MRRVLIADPDTDSRSILGRFLRHNGYDHLEIAGPDGVLELVLRERPDVLVTEVFRTRSGGLEPVESLRAEPGAVGLPVVVWSAFVDPETERRVVAAGAVFLAKPSPPHDVVCAVEDLLRRRADPPDGSHE